MPKKRVYYRQSMNYDEINADKVLEEIETAIGQGDYRQVTRQETMQVRLAAIVRNLQEIVEKAPQLVNA